MLTIWDGIYLALGWFIVRFVIWPIFALLGLGLAWRYRDVDRGTTASNKCRCSETTQV